MISLIMPFPHYVIPYNPTTLVKAAENTFTYKPSQVPNKKGRGNMEMIYGMISVTVVERTHRA